MQYRSQEIVSKAILLIRNPANMLISYRNLASGGHHNAFATPDMFKVISCTISKSKKRSFAKKKLLIYKRVESLFSGRGLADFHRS